MAAAAAAAFVQKFAIIYGAVSARRNFFFRPYRIRITLPYERVLYPPMWIVLSIPHTRAVESVRFRYSSSLPEHSFPPSKRTRNTIAHNIRFLSRTFFIAPLCAMVSRALLYLLRAPRASALQSDVIELAPDIIAL